jgi:hypothetical protein
MHAASRTRSSLGIRLAEDPSATRWSTTLACAVMVLAGCGGSSSTSATITKPVDTSTLVGTWGGSVEGGSGPNSYGFSVIAFTLKADSTLTTKAENPSYCAASGSWTVKGAEWRAEGRDCTNTFLTFTAPLSSTRLAGSWTASSGRAGTFTVAKLP